MMRRNKQRSLDCFCSHSIRQKAKIFLQCQNATVLHCKTPVRHRMHGRHDGP
ncbi:hypothetical protein BIWAKO_02038 [Bosea sp. BIWAKO-01]|nr:hypothetical protein BIWAKO_02038 [Bosea sp. BIWAKO-01]